MTRRADRRVITGSSTGSSTKRVVSMTLVAIAFGLLPGCVSIPTDSPVRQGRQVGARDEPQLNSNLPPGPAVGAGRDDIVAGFFAAMLAYPRSDSLARSFLTPSAAKSWDPSATLVVYDDQEITPETDAISVQARRLGALDGRGAWLSSTPGTSQVGLSIHTELVDGEYRVSDPPAGSYIDEDYFERYLDPFSIYYFDPTGTILTPDPVYLQLGESTPTTLVRDLLKGPGSSLAGVVSTAAPDGVKVASPVTVSSSGLAVIPLTEQAQAMSADQRRLLAAQLAWTLRPLGDIETIALTVNARRLEVRGSGTRFGVDDFSGYDPAGLGVSRQLFGLTSGGLVTVTASGASPVLGAIASAPKEARAAAVDPVAAQAALVNTDGTKVVVGSVSSVTAGTAVWFTNGHDLLRPSWDIHEVLWLVDQTDSGAKVYTVTSRRTRKVAVPGISGERVLGFAISRDGTRLAAVVDTGDSTRLVIAVIDRQPSAPAKVSISPARGVFGPEVAFSGSNSVAWSSPTSVAVLANDEGGDQQPFDISIDGSDVNTFDGFLPIRPVSATAAPNADLPLVVGSAQGQLYERGPEVSWTRLGGTVKIRAPLYPG